MEFGAEARTMRRVMEQSMRWGIDMKWGLGKLQSLLSVHSGDSSFPCSEQHRRQTQSCLVTAILGASSLIWLDASVLHGD